MRPPEDPPPAAPLHDAVLDPALPAAGTAPRLAGLRLAGLRVATVLPALLLLATVLAPPLNHDVAAVLNFAERMLAGERLYADLIDVNPPLVFLLDLPPALIAAWTPLDAAQALLLFLLAGLAAAAWLTWRLLPARAPVEAACLAAGLPVLLLSAGYDFGQREHIMAIFAMPYLMLAARRADGVVTGWGWQVAAVLPAAIGFALKPYFLVIPALVELVVLLRRGRRGFSDPVPWAMAGLWLAYLLVVLLLFPDYTSHVLPLVWAYYLDQGAYSWWQVLLTERLGTAMLLLLPLALLALPGRRGALPAVLAAAGIGAAISAVVQHKGWTYHALPVRLFASLLGVMLAARWADRALSSRAARRLAAGAAAIAACGLGLFNVTGAEAPWRELGWSGSRGAEMTALLKREAYGERLLVLSSDIFPVYPALNYARAQSTLRTMNLWLLQGVYRDCPRDAAGKPRFRETWEMARAEFYVYRTVAEDFARAPPAALLVAADPGLVVCGQDFDILAYFARHPLFAETLERYRPAATIAGYQLLRRED